MNNHQKITILQAMGVSLVLGFASANSAYAAGDGIPTFDWATYTQALESVKNGVTQIKHLENQIQNQITLLNYWKQNLNQFKFNDLNSIQNSINSLLTLQSNLDNVVKKFGVDNVQSFLDSFKLNDSFNADPCLKGNCTHAEQKAFNKKVFDENVKKNTAVRNSFSAAYEFGDSSLKEGQKSLDNTKKTMQSAKTAAGQMEILGAITELLAEQNNILVNIQQNIVVMNKANSLNSMKTSQDTERAVRQQKKFMGIKD